MKELKALLESGQIFNEIDSLKDTNNRAKLLISRNRNSKVLSQKELFDLLELFNLQFLLLSKQLRDLR